MAGLRTLLTTTLFPPSVGGAQNFYYNIARYYPNNNIVILADSSSDAEAFDENQRYSIYRKPIGKIKNQKNFILIIHLIIYFWYLFTLVKKEKIEHIIVGQCCNIVHVSASILIAKFLEIPITLFAHGEEITGVLKNDFKSKPVLKFLYRFSDYFIANSRYTKGIWEKLGCDPDRIYILTPCVDTDFFYPLPNPAFLKAKYNLSQKKVLLTVARLELRKGHDIVIKSLPILKEKFSNITYIVVGEGEEKEYLADLSKKYDIDKEIFFWGEVTKEKLREAFNICDLFIMPNREVGHGDLEGFGTVFIEANSCGKPVIGGRSGGTEDAIENGKSGILCKPNSVEDFVEKTTLLLSNNDLCKRIAEYGKKRVKTFFDYNKKIPEFFSEFPPKK